jgi:hypothetical protein
VSAAHVGEETASELLEGARVEALEPRQWVIFGRCSADGIGRLEGDPTEQTRDVEEERGLGEEGLGQQVLAVTAKPVEAQTQQCRRRRNARPLLEAQPKTVRCLDHPAA